MVENLLRDEIKSEFESLRKMEVGTEQYKTTVDGLSKLVDKSIEFEKLNIDCRSKDRDREMNLELKEAEMKATKKDRWMGHIMTGLSIGVPAALAVWGTKRSFEFEKEGTITTIMGRGFINKLLPKK